MKLSALMPQSMLARTTLVIALALILSQSLSVWLFRFYSVQPRQQLVNNGYISHLKTIRAALELIPDAAQNEFMLKLREEKGIRVQPATRIRDDAPLELAPDIPALRNAREKLKELFGNDADIYVFERPKAKRLQAADAPPPQLLTKLPVKASHVWVVFPQNRVLPQDFFWAWLSWGLFGAFAALGGAVFLALRLNRPLKGLAQAAKAIGLGEVTKPVEGGPTEVRAVAAAFEQMKANLDRKDHERTIFLAGVSHDLRTPLARLRLGVEMLPVERSTISDFEADINDINKIIDQFLDFGRNENTEITEQVDLDFLLRGAAERAVRAIQSSGQTKTVQLNLGNVGGLKLRPVAMQRLVDNLMENARKHGGDNIELATSQTATHKIISIFDDGIGIPPELVNHLKQPFTRLDGSRTGASGAGLGLAIVERICAMHGGTFTLLSRGEKPGVEARVTLPI
jgi:two-component system, OmpR family, osmolarity sensor histidine kinase EnvZ